ncbi:hypothetical protein GCM10017566_67080 [Amycolatopsis bartoniae]|uniref:Uncharacterized protein n=1 Tax=Amycolatopsis bartoniae TaxID=941986 RepID=A0A8H9J1A7_9PSEU|nr:hypothetical protein GCM10017566_67080 [Amycolatopsis bartoniae]
MSGRDEVLDEDGTEIARPAGDEDLHDDSVPQRFRSRIITLNSYISVNVKRKRAWGIGDEAEVRAGSWSSRASTAGSR